MQYKYLHLLLLLLFMATTGHQYPFRPSVINISLISVTTQMDLAVCAWLKRFLPCSLFAGATHRHHCMQLSFLLRKVLGKEQSDGSDQEGSLKDSTVVLATTGQSDDHHWELSSLPVGQSKSESNQDVVGHTVICQSFIWRHNAGVLVSTIFLPAYDYSCQITCVSDEIIIYLYITKHTKTLSVVWWWWWWWFR